MAATPPVADSLSGIVDTVKLNSLETSIDNTLNGAGFFPANIQFDVNGNSYWQLNIDSIPLNRYERTNLKARYVAVGWNDMKFIDASSTRIWTQLFK